MSKVFARPVKCIRFVLLLFLCYSWASYGAIKLPSIIGSNMVLQQNSSALLWGWSNPDDNIAISCSWDQQVFNASASSAGKWQVSVPTPQYSGPYTITITSSDDSVTLSNIMIGEVWLCSGQSNMQCYVGPITWPGVFDYQQVIDSSENPNIRLFTVGSKSLEIEPLDDCVGSWQSCAPQAVETFSAVAYFFARELNNELGMAIGVINASLGGTRIESWSDEQSLRTLGYCDSELDSYTPQTVLDVNSATALYNSMIAPLIPYRIAGAIWYQGEANVNNADQYQSLFTAMVAGWRSKWQQGDFPFYFAQIAPFTYPCGNSCAATLRQAQFNSLNLTNTGMVVTTDLVDNINDLHPRNKEDVGKRFSLLALSKNYGQTDKVCSGPLFKSLKAEVGSLRVYFDYADGGLVAKDGELTHFQIASQDMNFVDAAAVIQNDTVVVSSANIPTPYAVRFGWANDAVPNLFNSSGLPASPFEASVTSTGAGDSVALSGSDIFFYGDINSGWTYSDPGNYHVSESMYSPGITGYSLSFTNSTFDSTNCNLTFTAGQSLNAGGRIPNNSTVYVGAWVKKSTDFSQTQSNSGPEIWIKATSPYNNEDYRSNTAVSLSNSLTFGWSDASSIPYSQVSSSEWKYFEFPVQVGYSGSAGGWSSLAVNVCSRVGWGGDLAAGFNGTIYFDNITVKINKQIANEPSEFTQMQNNSGDAVRFAVDANYALESVIVDGVSFKSSLEFPTFVVRSSGGDATLKPYDSNWQIAADVNEIDSVALITYSRPEIEVKVKYEFSEYGLLISAEPVRETSYKLIGLNSGSAMLAVGSTSVNSSEAFVLSPFGGGEVINFDSAGSSRNSSHLQNWTFQAGFTGIGYNGRGLMVRSPQQGAIWSYGRQYIRDDYSVVCGLETFYRPQASAYSMPISDNKIEIQLVTVKDENLDGEFDWVDMGYLYSDLFIKRNETLDPALLNSVVGKIDVSAPPVGVLDYSQLLPQIEAIDFAPQIWWLVGAHTSPEKSYCDPPYSVEPDASYRGDYFAFKASCAAAGAKIGLHEMAQDITPQMPDWPVPVMLRSDGQPYVSGWSAYFKAIDDKGFFYFLNKHFKNWHVEDGDSWHWDVLTAEAPRENYDPDRVATYGKNFRDRVNLLKYVKEHGIHITSEGLQEQMAQYCDMGWHAVIAGNEMVGGSTGGQGEFESTTHVPLLPVLFLGKSYYAMAWPVAKNLLYGGRYVYEGVSIDAAQMQAGMMPQVNAWSSIANRRVTDIDYDGGVWTVKYSPEATLTANLSNNTWTLDIPNTCETASHISQDINKDCNVDLQDFAILGSNWGRISF